MLEMKKMVELCCIFALAVLWLAKDASGTEYVYKQMTPKLDQPWYFNSAASIAADSNDRIYIADSFEHQVKKFTSSGVFITQWGWGTPGTGTGEFNKLEDIAVDPSDNVYLVDQDNYRIQKFSKDGQFLKEWGKKGDGPGQFNFPASIAIDPDGYVYVIDSQNGNVQKFTSDGDFVAKWGDQGPAGEQLDGPTGIAADSSGHIYVADNGNQCVKKYTGDGNLLLQWDFYSAFYNPVSLAVDAADQVYLIEYNKYGANGQIKIFTPDGGLVSEWGDQQYVWPVPDTGHFYSASGMCVDSKGNIYVPDFSYKSVLKYKADRSFIEKWDSRGRGPGEFSSPNDMAMDAQGYVYIADSLNDRVQKFTPDMTFVTQWGSYGQQDGEFHNPSGLAIDPSGNVYVLEWGNNRIQKFGPDGTLVKNWGEQSLFEYSSGIAVDQAGYVYVADSPGRKVIKYTADGFHVAQWDVEGTWSDPLQPFNNTCLAGIAVDSKGHVYVGDVMDNKVHKFAPDGSVISKWDLAGAAGGGGGPASLYVDAQDFVFVSDGASIHKFSPDGELTDTWGGHGSVPGKFGHISGMAVNGDGDLYVTDETLSRVQVLSPKSQVEPGQSKVIIVAGGGNHKDNNLWDATQFCANYAYRALTFQGYTKETIYYLSPSLGLNLGPEGSLPDVDEDATKGNLEKAITSWADDAGELVLYMVDHGGPENFLMRKGELLLAPELSAWLDQHQAKTNTNVTIVYDACDAGSFIEALSSPVHDRVFIASTADGEDAHFVSTGQISFSYFFWGGDLQRHVRV